jgi:hypothetical protein
MKSKFLKDRKQYVKEHFAFFFNESGIPSTDNSENLVEEETEETEFGSEFESEYDSNSDSFNVDIEVTNANDELPSNVPNLLNQLPQNVTTDMLAPQPTICDPMNTNFTTRNEWCVIKCMTNNGIRVGLDKQSETECEVLAGNLSYNDAITKVEEVASQQGCPVFNDDMDEYVGRVSKAYIKKPVVSNTVSPSSYKPSPNSYGSSDNSFKGAL